MLFQVPRLLIPVYDNTIRRWNGWARYKYDVVLQNLCINIDVEWKSIVFAL